MEAATIRFVSLLASCLLASTALALWYYGPVELAVGPGWSRLVQASSVFVQGFKVSCLKAESQGNDDGLVLYGLAGAPLLDVPAEWSEARRAVVPAYSHKEWAYFLNKGAQIEAAYSVKSETDVPYPLCITIAQGEERFMQWTEIPSAHSNTLSWDSVQDCITTENGTIERKIDLTSEYYIAVHNLNDHQDATVQLNITIRTMLYNTTGADYRCSPGHDLCTYRLPFLGQNVAVLSSGLKEGLNSDARHVELSYEPRWIVYIVGSAILAIMLLLLHEILDMLFGPCTGGGRRGADRRSRTPLLPESNEDDGASLGSSYDSVSHDGSDGAEERGEGGCVLCCDAPKDCFFLPCGHSATCYACGARILEGGGGCPFCRRKLKKVKRIFAV